MNEVIKELCTEIEKSLEEGSSGGGYGAELLKRAEKMLRKVDYYAERCTEDMNTSSKLHLEEKARAIKLDAENDRLRVLLVQAGTWLDIADGSCVEDVTKMGALADRIRAALRGDNEQG